MRDSRKKKEELEGETQINIRAYSARLARAESHFERAGQTDEPR